MNSEQLGDAIQQVERSLLSCLLSDASLRSQTEGLNADDFSLDSHRQIYGCMEEMYNEGRAVDRETLGLELATRNKFETCDVWSLVDQGLPANFRSYVKDIKKAARERRHQHLLTNLAAANTPEERAEISGKILALANGNAGECATTVRILSEVETKIVDWLWEPFIPFGMLTIITGDPGVGKSFIALAIAAKETRAGRVVLYLTVENSAAYTLRPRFDALEGDASKIVLLDEIAADGIRRAVTLQDFAILEKVIRDYKVQLVVVDPIQSYLGADVDAHRSNETRPILDGLAKLAERYHLAVLILRHAAKNSSGRAIFKGLGCPWRSQAARKRHRG